MISEFFGDLRQALVAWKRAPMLPILSVSLYVVLSLFNLTRNNVFFVVGLVVAIFYAGYVGTERIWYVAAWRGERMTLGDVWRISGAFLPRFLALSVVWGVTGVVLALLLSLVGDAENMWRQEGIAFVFLLILFDVAFTFVTPALAFTTDKVGEAIGIGWSLLQRAWPRSAAYALVPPLAGTLLLRTLPASVLNPSLRFAFEILSVLFYLAMKGATAAFYLRHEEFKWKSLKRPEPTITRESLG